MADSGEKDGGFCAVPGFHKKIEEWSKLTQETEFCKCNIKSFEGVSVPQGAKKIRVFYIFFRGFVA